MIVLVDMDGVVADFVGTTQSWLHYEYGITKHPTITTLAMEQFYPKETRPYFNYIWNEPSFWKSISVVDGAQDAIKELSKKHDVIFCSAPFPSCMGICAKAKLEWLEQLFNVKSDKVILARDKTLIYGDILIDDKPEVTGINKSPSWVHILYDQPYNRKINKPRITWTANWKEEIDRCALFVGLGRPHHGQEAQLNFNSNWKEAS